MTMKKTLMIKLVCATSIAALAACGGGSGPRTAEVEPLASTENVTSTLGGVALQSNGSTGVLSVLTTEGTLMHESGAVTLNDGTYTLSDADGVDDDGLFTDGTSTVSTESVAFTGDYDFTQAYEQTYTADGIAYDSTGITGVVIDARDMPSTGNATFTGEAIGSVNVAADGFDLTAGTSTLTATFSSDGGTIDLVMSDFTSTSQSGDDTSVNPIDTISALGMTIDGNGFTGGTLTTALDGTDVDIIGGSTTTAATGSFFGYNSDVAQPDEVGS
jgi:hypothetical protein